MCIKGNLRCLASHAVPSVGPFSVWFALYLRQTAESISGCLNFAHMKCKRKSFAFKIYDAKLTGGSFSLTAAVNVMQV